MDSNAFNPSSDITFTVKNNSSMRRAITVFGTKITYGNSLDLMKIPGVSEEDIRSELTKGSLKVLVATGALTVTSCTVNLATVDTNHANFLNSVGLSGAGAGGGGVEILIATPGSSNSSPVGNLNLGVQVSILSNQTGAAAIWHLPDGTDGTIHEIVSSGLGTLASGAFIGVTSTNGFYGGNDLLDLNPGNSVRLVWSTAGGGWVAVSTCENVNVFWD